MSRHFNEVDRVVSRPNNRVDVVYPDQLMK